MRLLQRGNRGSNVVGLGKIQAFVIAAAVFFAAAILSTATPSHAQNPSSQLAIEFSILRDAPQDATINDICCGALNAKFKRSVNRKFSTDLAIRPSGFILKNYPAREFWILAQWLTLSPYTNAMPQLPNFQPVRQEIFFHYQNANCWHHILFSLSTRKRQIAGYL